MTFRRRPSLPRAPSWSTASGLSVMRFLLQEHDTAKASPIASHSNNAINIIAEFANLGMMAYIGDGKASIQIEGGGLPLPGIKMSGGFAFLLWRSVYITKQVRAVLHPRGGGGRYCESRVFHLSFAGLVQESSSDLIRLAQDQGFRQRYVDVLRSELLFYVAAIATSHFTSFTLPVQALGPLFHHLLSCPCLRPSRLARLKNLQQRVK